MLQNNLTLTERKIDLVLRLFVSSADEDYISARWNFSVGGFGVFYWCAAQTVEKYFKAVLLLNGVSSKSFGHDLLKLFAAVRLLDQSGALAKAINLRGIPVNHQDVWDGKKFEDLLIELNIYGSPDARYRSEGHFAVDSLLHSFDQLCLAARELISMPSVLCDNLLIHTSREVFGYEKIVEPKKWMINPRSKLERLYFERFDVFDCASSRLAFLGRNYSFSDGRLAVDSSMNGLSLHGSPLYNHLVRLRSIDTRQENQDTTSLLAEWIRQNIKLSKVTLTKLGL